MANIKLKNLYGLITEYNGIHNVQLPTVDGGVAIFSEVPEYTVDIFHKSYYNSTDSSRTTAVYSWSKSVDGNWNLIVSVERTEDGKDYNFVVEYTTEGDNSIHQLLPDENLNYIVHNVNSSIQVIITSVLRGDTNLDGSLNNKDLSYVTTEGLNRYQLAAMPIGEQGYTVNFMYLFCTGSDYNISLEPITIEDEICINYGIPTKRVSGEDTIFSVPVAMYKDGSLFTPSIFGFAWKVASDFDEYSVTGGVTRKLSENEVYSQYSQFTMQISVPTSTLVSGNTYTISGRLMGMNELPTTLVEGDSICTLYLYKNVTFNACKVTIE